MDMGSECVTMVIAVVGSRTFTDYNTVCKVLDNYADTSDTIVSGGAKGADSLARRYANEHGLKLIEHLPDWKIHGRVAGFIRNELIVDDADVMIAFWDGQSRGTQHSIDLANRKHIQVHIIKDRSTK
ncbi:hypothetical protein LCGC14_0593340 [marine sediment metagenome]|uniref:YspA cpYpsA-related SLOG domain-containing protein n=1 Tax=marine sediment metagenome TaxID=412755 RepID=A0A0F9TZ15_9ZZZZ